MGRRLAAVVAVADKSWGAGVRWSWLLAASSWIEAPMWPMPMTAQTYAVLIIGAAGGARLSAATVGAYLVQGALGRPTFARGARAACIISLGRLAVI